MDVVVEVLDGVVLVVVDDADDGGVFDPPEHALSPVDAATTSTAAAGR